MIRDLIIRIYEGEPIKGVAMFSMDDLADYDEPEAIFFEDEVIEDPNLTSYLRGCEHGNEMVMSILEDGTISDFEKKQKIDLFRVTTSYVAEEFYSHFFNYGLLSRGLIELVNEIESHHSLVLEDYRHYGVTIGKPTEKGVEVFFHGRLAYLIQNVSVDFILTSSGINPEEYPDFQILAGYLQRPKNFKVILDVHIHNLLVANDLFD